MAIDLSKFTGTLPYDSQMFGIYQPLLGWKSALQVGRLNTSLSSVRQTFLGSLTRGLSPTVSIQSTVIDAPRYNLDIAALNTSLQPNTINGIDSLVTRHVMKAIAEAGADDPSHWKQFTAPDFLRIALNEIQDQIKDEYLNGVRRLDQSAAQGSPAIASSESAQRALLASILTRESIAAGTLALLNQQHTADQLRAILSPNSVPLIDISLILSILDTAGSDITRAVLSPIGIVHLFREYFFEFATFLGPPTQHVWLSPGGTVELVEISTRKTIVERTIEQVLETINKSEKDTTTQDELSDAVKQENSTDTKLGVSATSDTNYQVGFVSGSLSVTGSYNLDEQQKQAREQTHKSTRQQTQKLSSEIRQSYKSTFKTVTETTDTTSKRYVLQNATEKLMNYELRRKMRQIGVQLQDFGTRLCWQAYVDNPGDTLGVPIFVHAAPPPDLQNIKAPEMPPAPTSVIRGDAITLRGRWDHGDVSQTGFVPVGSPARVIPPPGYVCFHVDFSARQGNLAWAYGVWPSDLDSGPLQIPSDQAAPIDPVLDKDITQIGNDADKTTEKTITQVRVGVLAGGGLRDSATYDIAIEVIPLFRPSLEGQKAAQEAYEAGLKNYKEETKLAYQRALFESIRERVKLASNIQPRAFSELREEERIVVYRNLVRHLLDVAGIKTDDPHVRHVFSEVVGSMFDMENMLYFVAPDWWMPRQITTSDALSGLGASDADKKLFKPGAPGSAANIVGWGGPRASRPEDYYITDDSAPAKLGSSLGWLLQLDGDNFRNAFLNAPWVKAVIPLREGHEWKALEWLTSPSVEGSEGLDAKYQENFEGEKAEMIEVLKRYNSRYSALTPDGFTIRDAIHYLIVVVQQKQEAARKKTADASYLPADKVFEHGFDPLQGGFVAQPSTPFEVFDQWIEVLPTDQIVPVEVTYDPKTGLQV